MHSVNRSFYNYVGLACCFLLASTVSGHPGHGAEGASHDWAAAEHLLPLLVAGVAALALGVGLRWRTGATAANRYRQGDWR